MIEPIAKKKRVKRSRYDNSFLYWFSKTNHTKMSIGFAYTNYVEYCVSINTESMAQGTFNRRYKHLMETHTNE